MALAVEESCSPIQFNKRKIRLICIGIYANLFIKNIHPQGGWIFFIH